MKLVKNEVEEGRDIGATVFCLPYTLIDFNCPECNKRIEWDFENKSFLFPAYGVNDFHVYCSECDFWHEVKIKLELTASLVNSTK